MPDGATMPFWPRVLREALAARYVGLSATKFRQQVYPAVAPVRLSAGCIGWKREDLDRWVDALPQTRIDQPGPVADAAPAPQEPPADARDAIRQALAALAPPRRSRRQDPAR